MEVSGAPFGGVGNPPEGVGIRRASCPRLLQLHVLLLESLADGQDLQRK